MPPLFPLPPEKKNYESLASDGRENEMNGGERRQLMVKRNNDRKIPLDKEKKKTKKSSL